MRACMAVGMLIVASSAVGAEFEDRASHQWHQWRGPQANGVAPHGNPPSEWAAETNIKWKTPIPGRGSASPIVWDDRIFLLTAVDTGRSDEAVEQTGAEEPVAEQLAADASMEESRERGRLGGRRGFLGRRAGPQNYQQYTVVCVDRTSGDVLWQKVAREAVPLEAGHQTNSHASASAVTDGERLYCSFGSHGLYCYDYDGELLWERDLGDMQTRNGFGEGATPTLYKETLVVAWDHEGDSFITALDAATGDERWKTPRDEVTTWNTPLVVEAAGRTQAIVNGSNRTRSYDLATGEQIWECGGQATNPIASPVAHGGLVFCMTGHRGSAVVAIPLDAEGDITGSEQIAWQTDQGGPYVPSPLLYGERLYFHKASTGVLSCLGARDGAPLFDQKRLPGIDNVYASPVGAAGRVYLTARDGTTLVIRDGDELEVLAANSVGEPVDASPAIVGDELFIRGENHLFCISEEGK